MLAYAANRPVVAQRGSSPQALLGIIAGHVAVVALVMSIRMDLPQRIKDSPLVIDLIQEDDPPPPRQPEIKAEAPARPLAPALDQPPRIVPTPALPTDIAGATPAPVPSFDQLIGPAIEPLPPRADPPAKPAPAPTKARLLTPASDLRPPYPASKLASGEEAVLRLRLSIDERGRVVAVEPVGRADRAFVEAARRHLVARWRYTPASDGGRSIASTTVITLRFQLEG